ncbi:hypothetical protein Z968_13080 [Clostridium novyi A str. 4552]|uniref:Uracil-DNA glycosylase-like domain-containing protein n=1 Tax=Clostridium novyi A str. 4552 TaxID=1444289 RepID=A0A0A0HWB5_CLONO|nr:hypothetical protein [Clostridium novyi]KGM92857.1 hypothetical protein Z968_13080 [Clostridium novyi A str. 4552]
MMKTLHNYKEIIKKFPMKDKYNKEELLVEEFLIEKQNNIEIYYAPHNEYINPKAKIFIIGISPGFQQMSTAIAIARKELELTEDIKLIQYKCKVAGRFSGSLRKNIISMLDEIKVNKVLNIETSKELFYSKDHLLHTVSLIPYPVFVKGKNYSGHTPKLINTEFLMKYVYNNFINELKSLNNFKEVLLIPLGKAVEEVLLKLGEENIINKSQILMGFPHPSGANVNRKVQFKGNRENMIAQVRKFFMEKP